MASFKAKFPVLQELFAKNHRGGALWAPPPPSGARVNPWRRHCVLVLPVGQNIEVVSRFQCLLVPSVSQKNVIVYFAHTAKIKSRIFKYNGSNDSSNDGNLFHAYHHHCTCLTLALRDVLKVATFSEVADVYPFHHTIDGAGTHGIRDRPHGTPDRCL